MIFECLIFNQKNQKVYREYRKVRPIQKVNKLTETIPEESYTLEVLDKHFITTILNIFKQPNEKDKKLNEIRKTMQKQNKNISKEIKIVKVIKQKFWSHKVQ